MVHRPASKARWLPFVGVVSALMGCRSTVDYLGYDRVDALAPINCPAPYRGAYADVLGRRQEEIDAKLDAAFAQLFGADPNETIYFTLGSSQAFIRDVWHHNEVRTEGIGLGMLICAMLDKRQEFDRLWRYVAANLVYPSGELEGYFRSHCDLSQFVPTGTVGESRTCADPYGLQQITMALLLARQRWAVTSDSPNYGDEAKKLLDRMRGKDAAGSGGNANASAAGGAGSGATAGADGVGSTGGMGGGTAGGNGGAFGIPNGGNTSMSAGGNNGAPNTATAGLEAPTFDSATKLVFDEPALNPPRQTGTSLEMPAYYHVWAQVTGDAFFAEAAVAARRFLVDVAHPETGLVPVRATFTGEPVPGWGDFSAEAYRTFVNLIIDRLWASSDPWQTPQINRALAFFSREGLSTYGAAYSLDGRSRPIPDHFPELVYVNGALAALSTNADRRAYLQAAWNEPIPSGQWRYYRGLLYLVSNLILGGRMQLCP